jgi:hypothetical protein
MPWCLIKHINVFLSTFQADTASCRKLQSKITQNYIKSKLSAVELTRTQKEYVAASQNNMKL